MKRNQRLLIVVIIVIGFVLRFVYLSQFPVLHRDEAFLGYNAFSILKTGKDMTGEFLPIHFKSFLYSPGGYSYLSIPFMLIFGFNEFSIRAASAFFGTASIGMLFLLVHELFKKRKEGFIISSLASFFLAVLPWHVNMSRTATENVIVVFFLLLGSYLYILWARRTGIALFIGAFLCFVITIFLYQAPRSFLPFYLPLLFLCFVPRKRTEIACSLFSFLFVIVIPIFLILISPNLALRIQTVSIFSTDQTQLVINEQITQEAVAGVQPLVSRIFHNKLLGYSDEFIKNYFDHFSFEFLFTENSLPDRYRVPLTGIVYLVMLPFIIFGLYSLYTKHKKLFYFIGGTLLFVPIGSALAFDDIPNQQRTLFMAPILCLIASVGLFDFITYFKNKKIRMVSVGFLGILFAFSIVFYLRQYYIHMPVYRPWFRNDGYKDLVRIINERSPGYKKIVITNRESAPTIFFLVFSKFDPKAFQDQTKDLLTHDFDRVPFDKFEFVTDECPLTAKISGDKRIVTGKKEILYVNSSLCNTIEESNVIDTIKRKDGSEVFHVTVLK